MIRFAIFIALILIMIAWAAGVMARPMPRPMDPCGPRDTKLAELHKEHGEVVLGGGVRSDNLVESAVVELLANPETGSWTILMTLPDMRSCVIAFGEFWSAEPAGDPL